MYYAEYDSESGMYCVFNTGRIGRFPEGHAFAGYASAQQAEDDATARNKDDLKKYSNMSNFNIARTLTSITLVANLPALVPNLSHLSEGEQLILSDTMGAYGYLVNVEESISLNEWSSRIAGNMSVERIPSGVRAMLAIIDKAAGT